eukprot:3480638-Rhodomonas_salina.1
MMGGGRPAGGGGGGRGGSWGDDAPAPRGFFSSPAPGAPPPPPPPQGFSSSPQSLTLHQRTPGGEMVFGQDMLKGLLSHFQEIPLTATESVELCTASMVQLSVKMAQFAAHQEALSVLSVQQERQINDIESGITSGIFDDGDGVLMTQVKEFRAEQVKMNLDMITERSKFSRAVMKMACTVSSGFTGRSGGGGGGSGGGEKKRKSSSPPVVVDGTATTTMDAGGGGNAVEKRRR